MTISSVKDKFKCYDRVELRGVFLTDIVFSHTWKNKIYYKATFGVERTSGYVDKVLLVLNKNVYDIVYQRMADGQTEFAFGGTLISYNTHDRFEEDKIHLNVKVMVYELLEDVENSNLVELDCYIVNTPKFKITKKQSLITSTIIAVNVAGKKSYYFPAITWGSAACNFTKFAVGTKLRIWGRLQSREIKNGTATTYEISIYKYAVIEE